MFLVTTLTRSTGDRKTSHAAPVVRAIEEPPTQITNMSFDDVLDLTTDDLFFFIILYYNVTPYIVRAIDVPYAACKVEFGEIPDLTADDLNFLNNFVL